RCRLSSSNVTSTTSDFCLGDGDNRKNVSANRNSQSRMNGMAESTATAKNKRTDSPNIWTQPRRFGPLFFICRRSPGDQSPVAEPYGKESAFQCQAAGLPRMTYHTYVAKPQRCT